MTTPHRSFARLALYFVLVLCLAACGDDPGQAPDGADTPTRKAATVPRKLVVREVAAVGQKLGGCDVGDVRTDKPGREIVAVAGDGGVYVVWREGEAWQHEKVVTLSGEMIQVAVGDVDPDHPGEEIVAVGMLEGPEGGEKPGAAHYIRWESGTGGGRWVATKIFEDERLLHAVAIHEIDDEHPGLEVVVSGFSNAAHLLRYENGTFEAEHMADFRAAAKNARGYGTGVLLACTDGALRHITPDTEKGEGYDVGILQQAEAGQARIGTAGVRVVAARDDGVLTVIAGSGEAEVIHTEPTESGDTRLRGAVLADIDPSAEGLEVATCGYRGVLMLFYPAEHGWTKLDLHKDAAGLHHLHGEDFLDEGDGVELVTCGYAGRILVVLRAPVASD